MTPTRSAPASRRRRTSARTASSGCGMSHVQGVAEDAGVHAERFQPVGDRLGLVRRMLGVASAREHDHVGS